MKKKLLFILAHIVGFLAKLTIKKYNPAIVGITGTVGKTSTKEAIGTLVAKERSVRAPLKSFNNELGLPLTILGDWKKTGGIFFWIKVIVQGIVQLIVRNTEYPEVLVLEYGVDAPNDMKKLLAIARPHIGVFTAMSEIPVHVEAFQNPTALFNEKALLITELPKDGFAILNGDDPKVMTLKDRTNARVITYGFQKTNDIQVSNLKNHIREEGWGVSCKIEHKGTSVPLQIEGLGKSQGYVIGAASAVGIVMGMNLVTIGEALQNYRAPQGRLRIVPGLKQSLIIDDTYNSSPLATKEALEVLKSVNAKQSIAVLGDMLELGAYTLEAHEEIGRLAAQCADMILTVGLRGKFIAESALKTGFPKKAVVSFMSTREAGQFLQAKIQKDDVVLVKGSQGARMEKVVKEVMREPGHAPMLLVRQNKEWLSKPGLYE